MGKYTEYLQANNRAYIAVEIPKALRAHLDAEAGGKADARFIRELMAKATGFAGDPHAGFSTKKGVHEAGRKLAQSNRPEHTGAKAARIQGPGHRPGERPKVHPRDPLTDLDRELITYFEHALRELDAVNSDSRLDDANVEVELRGWLDGRDAPLACRSSAILSV